jgi:hypothetical protein
MSEFDILENQIRSKNNAMENYDLFLKIKWLKIIVGLYPTIKSDFV